MTDKEVIITRGILTCLQGGKEQQVAIPYLYLALSPAARKHLDDVFLPERLKELDEFVKEQHTIVEADGYKIEPEIRRGDEE